VGAQAVSDPLDFSVGSAVEPDGDTVPWPPGRRPRPSRRIPVRGPRPIWCGGNHIEDADLPGATAVDHWYFLSGVEVWSPGDTAGVAIVGDSLTDGRGFDHECEQPLA